MQVERFQHFRVRAFATSSPATHGGATVLLTGNTEDPSHITMRVAYCCPTDVFCKDLGRQYAKDAQPVVITLRSLPAALGRVFREVHKRSKVVTTMRVNYDSRIRDFLPKE